MSDDKELDDLLGLLFQKTRENKVQWTMNGASQIATRLMSNPIELNEVSPGRAYQLIVRNENGIVLSSAIFDSSTAARPLFDGVKRSALGVDQALFNIRNKLLQL